jgi:hypothetical protein
MGILLMITRCVSSHNVCLVNTVVDVAIAVVNPFNIEVGSVNADVDALNSDGVKFFNIVAPCDAINNEISPERNCTDSHVQEMEVLSNQSASVSLPAHAGEVAVPHLAKCKQSIIVGNRGIPLVQYVPQNDSPLYSLRFKPWLQLQIPYVLPEECNLDLLWHTGWFASSGVGHRPSWSSFMHDACGLSPVEDKPSEKASDFRMCPILDLNPNNMTCISSTQQYIIDRCKLLRVSTSCVTFDEPLWIKAIEVAHGLNLNIVVRLGSFHMLMSCLGSLGWVMSGSGLTEVLHTC